MSLTFNSNQVEIKGTVMYWMRTTENDLVRCVLPGAIHDSSEVVVAEVKGLGYVMARNRDGVLDLVKPLKALQEYLNTELGDIYRSLEQDSKKIPGLGDIVFAGEGGFPYLSWINPPKNVKVTSPAIHLVLPPFPE